LIGFASALRRSELCAIDCTDIERVPQGIVITLKRGKTDQDGRGRQIGIPHGKESICAIRALDDWLLAAGIREGAVFRSVSRQGQIGVGPLCDRSVAVIVKKCAKAAGLEASRYSGHSLRAGSPQVPLRPEYRPGRSDSRLVMPRTRCFNATSETESNSSTTPLAPFFRRSWIGGRFSWSAAT
jgi:hypothetical protein